MERKWRILCFILATFVITASLGFYYHFVYLPKQIKRPDELKFAFSFTRKPTNHFQNSTDMRELASAFDYIQILDRNKNVLASIEFNSGDEKYFGGGWYGIESWTEYGEGMNASWAGKEAIIKIKIPEEAHFIKIKAASIGKTKYQEWDAPFKVLMSDPQRMKVYLNDKIVDEIDLYSRMQISYVNLRPDIDSDGDGIVNKYDINPMIPNPKPIKTDVNISVYYLPAWGLFKGKTSSDWHIKKSLHPFLGNYTSDDPDTIDWHIKWAVEHSISSFIIPFTKPHSGWEIAFENGFLRAKFLPYIKFSIMFNNEPWWPNNPLGNDPAQLGNLTHETISYIANNYFDMLNYLKIKDKSSLFLFHHWIYHMKFGENEALLLTDNIRKAVNQAGHDVYLVGDEMYRVKDYGITPVIESLDAITSYVEVDAGDNWKKDEKGRSYLVYPYDKVTEGYLKEAQWWSEYCKENGKGFIPPLNVGFNNQFIYEMGLADLIVFENPSPEKFKEMAKNAELCIDPELNMLVIEAWNEFDEGAVLEPTVEHEFAYLNVLPEVFCKKPLEGWPSWDSINLKDIMILRVNSGYEVRLVGLGQKLVFLEPEVWQGNSDVYPVVGGARVGHQWSHFLMFSPGKWLTDRVKSEGQFLISFKVLQDSGKVVTYYGCWGFRDYFVVSALHHLWVDGNILYRYVETNLTVLKDIPDPVGAVWVELMNDPNYYEVAVAKTTQGIVTKDMRGTTGHMLTEYLLDSYGWIALYKPLASDILGSPALVYLESTHTVHPTVYDGPNADNIELHLMGKDETRRLTKGESFKLHYLLIVSPETQGYDWVDPAINRAKPIIEAIRFWYKL